VEVEYSIPEDDQSNPAIFVEDIVNNLTASVGDGTHRDSAI